MKLGLEEVEEREVGARDWIELEGHASEVVEMEVETEVKV